MHKPFQAFTSTQYKRYVTIVSILVHNTRGMQLLYRSSTH